MLSDEEGDDFQDDEEFFDENGKLYPELRGKFVPKPQDIDLEGISQRVVSLPVPTGIYDRIVGLDGDRVMFVSCQSRSRRVGAENGIFFEFPMFVPSLSWKNVRFYM